MTAKVGRYELGTWTVTLYLNPNEGGGSFDAVSDGIEIVVGGKRPWAGVVGVLVHEAMELCLSDMRARFKPDIDYADSADGYLFAMNHEQFSEACARVGIFVASCINDLCDAYRRSKRPRKVKRHGRKNRRRKDS